MVLRMSLSRRLLAALLATATSLIAAPALAADPGAVATATGAGAPPTVADQIDAYLKTSPAIAPPKDAATGVTSGAEPRKVHGVVDVAVGTGGYRSAYVRSDLPVGTSGTLSIAVEDTRFGRSGRFGNRFGPGGRQALGLGFGMGDGAGEDLRCRQAAADGPDRQLDPQLDGGRPRPCHAAEAPRSPQ